MKLESVGRLSPGAPRNAKIRELRVETGNLALPTRALCSPVVVTPIYGGFAYFFVSALGVGCWVLGGNVDPPRSISRNPTGR